MLIVFFSCFAATKRHRRHVLRRSCDAQLERMSLRQALKRSLEGEAPPELDERRPQKVAKAKAVVRDAKPHACPKCASSFSTARYRDVHVRTVHEKRRDHACPHCTYAGQWASDLTRHVRMVHEKCRDHACPHCAAAFGTAGHLATMCAQCTMWVRQLSNDVGEGESE